MLWNLWGSIGVDERFNIVRFCPEKLGGSGHDLDAVKEFNNYIDSIDIEGVPLKGITLTWCNRRENEVRIYSKLIE
mgnify:CR=1 FL=1